VCEIWESLSKIITEIVDPVSEVGFMEPDNLAKVAICVDELTPDGIFDAMDCEEVMSRMKLKL
jgi:hypothetical protein